MMRTNDGGFTLVELMIVVTLLGVVATLGALRLGQRDKEGAVSGLARELFARAAEARFLSLSSGCQAELILDPADLDHDGLIATVVLATQPGMSIPSPGFSQASDGVSKRRDAYVSAIAAGTSLGGTPPSGPAGPDAVVFYPDGTVRLRSAPGRLGTTLYLQDVQRRHPYRVAIFGASGFARVLSR